MENKGIFRALKKGEKYKIFYIEKGKQIELELEGFSLYDKAEEYIKVHRDELDSMISAKKEAEKKLKEKEEEEKTAREAAEKAKKEEKEKKKVERKEKWQKFWSNITKGWVKFVAGFLVAVVLLTGGHFFGKGISNALKNKGSNKPTTFQTDPTISTEPKDPTIDIKNNIDEINNRDEQLNQENFEKIVAEYSKKYIDNSIDLTTEDIIKFVSIVNIDELLEENPDFAYELFGTQTWEAYMEDAMDVFAATYGYNYMTHMKKGNTDNFIWVSDCVYGTQKDKMLVVENYVKQIDLVKGKPDEVNKLVGELLERLSSGDLTNLDSGVRFGVNIYLELIRSYLAKDELTKENFDMITTIVEMYLNNIMTEYEKCSLRTDSGMVLARR